MIFTSALATVGLLASRAAAHGAVTSYVIGSQSLPGYEGFAPSTSPPTIQRQWPDYNPTMTITDKKVMCNGGTSAPLNATIAAGDSITAKWKQWTHQQGPAMVWMYPCAGDFKSCDGSGKKWFKIKQEGLISGAMAGNNWGTGVVYKNLAYTATIPKSLKAGNYLIRHELLALHQANTPQFYAECAQLAVTGSGTSVPSGIFVAQIPGYAAQSDPGVTVDVYQGKATTYKCPGPDVWTG